MPTSANCPKNPSDVRADVGIRAPILPLSQQPLVSSVSRAGEGLRPRRVGKGGDRIPIRNRDASVLFPRDFHGVTV